MNRCRKFAEHKPQTWRKQPVNGGWFHQCTKNNNHDGKHECECGRLWK